jgi:hypothetical protein
MAPPRIGEIAGAAAAATVVDRRDCLRVDREVVRFVAVDFFAAVAFDAVSERFLVEAVVWLGVVWPVVVRAAVV